MIKDIKETIPPAYHYLLDILVNVRYDRRTNKVIDGRELLVEEYDLMGSRKSAKTKTVALLCVMVVATKPGISVAAVRKIKEDLANSVVEEILWAIEELGLQDVFKHNKRDHTFTNIETKNKILCKGIVSRIDKGASLSGLADAKAKGWLVWCEEAYELTEKDVEDVQEAVRGHWYVFIWTKNPWSAANFQVRRLISFMPFDLEHMKKYGEQRSYDPLFKRMYHTTNFLINTKLSKRDWDAMWKLAVENPKRALTAVWGQPGIESGLSHPNFRPENIITEDAFNLFLRRHVRLWSGQVDYGLAHATTASISAVLSDNSTYVVLNEYYHSNARTEESKRKSQHDYIYDINNFFVNMIMRYPVYKKLRIVCDYGGGGEGFRQSMEHYRLKNNTGFNHRFYYVKAHKEDRDKRLAFMNGLIETPIPRYLVTNKCTDHIEELERSVIDKDILERKGQIVRVKEFDDTLDREDYGLTAVSGYLRGRGHDLSEFIQSAIQYSTVQKERAKVI